MIDRHSLLALNFYKSSPFTGSDGNMRYRVEKVELPLPDSEETEKKLQATIWPGPFSFAKTDDDKKTHQIADFSEEGFCELVEWLNKKQPEF